MPDPTPILLLTRPEAQSRRFAEAATNRFGPALHPIVSPLMKIVFERQHIPLEGVHGLVFTSENGVEAYLQMTATRDLPAWCVGDRTATAARKGGLIARSAQGDVQALARLLGDEGVVGPLLHLHGEHRKDILQQLLSDRGIELRSQQLYRQDSNEPALEASAALAGPAPVIAPIFSPRSARLFRAAFPQPRAPLTFIAISDAVAEALKQKPGERLLTADCPTAHAMLNALSCCIAAGPTA